MSEQRRHAVTVDCQYVKDAFAASYLRVEGEGPGAEAAFIDTGTSASIPHLMRALESAALHPEQVRWILVTHAHLDHSAGAGLLAEKCPNAQVVAHPRAARHLIDPTKLESSARKVYGDSVFESLYGARLVPIPAARMQTVQDGEELALGTVRLRFLHTRGHANHHVCIHDPALRTLYSGDSFGLRYPFLQKGGLFVLPSTSPTDFDGPEALISIDRILSCGIQTFRPTHFDVVSEVVEAAAQLRLDIEFSMELLDAAIRHPEASTLDQFCLDRLLAHYRNRVAELSVAFGSLEWESLAMDLRLNAAGVAHVARKCRLDS